mmetsp:Transcript_6810/g.17630  ORF Transcript_6810/g.17630 Transcript_6810/m.17630 type:complete len:80 (-) Transcript_6810:606-845(-)
MFSGQLIGKQGTTVKRLLNQRAASRLLSRRQPNQAVPSAVILGDETDARTQLCKAVEFVISSGQKKRKMYKKQAVANYS